MNNHFGPGDTRNSVREKLGEPTDTGGFSRKHPDPRIFKYDGTEFHFDFEDRLILIYRERNGVPVLSVGFNEVD
ncbi:MAG TPA: hypothetical protein VFV34_17345 [Blastocatellia bacterium]|nr:hypothetical protein [Blastocatellia bacterium]